MRGRKLKLMWVTVDFIFPVDLLTCWVNCCNVYDFIMLIKDIIFAVSSGERDPT